MTVTVDDMVEALLRPIEESFSNHGITADTIAESAALRKKLLKNSVKSSKKATKDNLAMIREDREEDKHIVAILGLKTPDRVDVTSGGKPLEVQVVKFAPVEEKPKRKPKVKAKRKVAPKRAKKSTKKAKK